MKDNVDVNGLHHLDHSGTDNNFMIKYMRVQIRAQISKHTEVAVLANLADFKNDPKSRVLENAYLKYTLDPKLALTFGQFRPLFGLEETYPIDINKSLDWSISTQNLGNWVGLAFRLVYLQPDKCNLGIFPFSMQFP
ncbi:OprO/OprP family phosphate-selective porin [Kaistella anthropi]|nr:OprO/OprP family phosphate-selective porin [Kaistella anthropi]